MLKVVEATTDAHRRDYRELQSEYLRWVAMFIGFNVEAKLEKDMANLGQFSPPDGCLLLAYDGDDPAGCACMRRIGPDVAELKRMYVRPDRRRKGIGRALTAAVIDRARRRGYRLLRLDTGSSAQPAIALYRSAGFRDIQPYPESEIPESYHHSRVCMELQLDNR